jgi:hypothetical protein
MLWGQGPHVTWAGSNIQRISKKKKKKKLEILKPNLNSMALVRERTILTGRLPLVGEVSANFILGRRNHMNPSDI